MGRWGLLMLLGLRWMGVCDAAPLAPCRIAVVEEGSGWAVPLVELRTTHQLRFVSDNNGVIAMDAPELLGEEVWFSVVGHGYEVAKDGFGYRGVRLRPTAGGELTVEVKRTVPGKRLGRLTGAGMFAESQKLGLEREWKEQGIVGCDSVQTAEFGGRLFWLWGDTTLAKYPLGIFDTLAGLTERRPLKSYEPPLRLRYDYFRNGKGAVRGVAKMPGKGPTWLSGLVSLPDEKGRNHLVANYVKIEGPLTVYERGLCVWDEDRAEFAGTRVLWSKEAGGKDVVVRPEGHAVLWTDGKGERWVLFGDPFPSMRCAANFEAWRDPGSWEQLEPQTTVPALKGGVEVTPHRGSIAWNSYRKKWVTVFTQLGGKPSGLGEIWYAEAESPTGPWGRAVKVVTHENYTFYNPRLHPEFTPEGSPILLFEGTYTRQFSGNPEKTPRHDYNQVMYRLDLDDPALRGE